MKITNQETTYLKKSKNFTIDLGNGKSVRVWKYVLEDEFESDADWGFCFDADEQEYKDWVGEDDDKGDEFQALINDLPMWDK